MKKKGLQGALLVFRFTLKQQLHQKGWRFTTILPTLILLIGIPAALMIADAAQQKEPDKTEITKVIVLDETGNEVDFSVLNQTEDPVYNDLQYIPVDSAESAVSAAEDCASAVILQVTWEDAFCLSVVKPDNSVLRKKDINAYADFLRDSFQMVSVQKAQLSTFLLMELASPVSVNVSTSQAYREQDEEDAYLMIREIMEMALPYLGIMLLYFMVLIYGQGIAGSMVLEKSSKLMDTMLLSLEPKGMILGKMLGSAAAGILQMLFWAVGLIGGCVIGRELVLQVDPDSTMGIMQFFEMLGEAGDLFRPANVILSVLILLSGFLMYCAIASVGGAMASRAEDLGACNSIFTILLLASFLLTMYGETDSSASMVSNAAWMNYVPFTAVLCTPARAVLGQVTPLCCVVSLVLILLVCFLAILFAGKLYRILTFHNGASPKIRNLPALLKTR